MSKRKWTADEEQTLIAMAENGHGRTVIAEALDRSIRSIQQKAFWLNISVAEWPVELGLKARKS